MSIGFRFDKDDSQSRKPRVEIARGVLVRFACQIISEEARVINADISQIELLAVCPIGVRSVHHGFDSMLNKPLERGGAGAGWVIEL